VQAIASLQFELLGELEQPVTVSHTSSVQDIPSLQFELSGVN